jgi:UDP-N-acetylglucosamine 1-carboxyvinyltransferase
VAGPEHRAGCGPAEVNGTKLDPRAVHPHAAPRSCWPGRCWARFGAADVPPPGGDVIGRRRVDTHLMAFAALGADVQVDREYRLRAPGRARRRRDPPRRGQRHRQPRTR